MRFHRFDILLLAGLMLCASALRAQTGELTGKIAVGTNRSYLLDAPMNIDRVLVASPEIAEAVVVNPRTIVINGHAQGVTSLLIWLNNGTRQQYEIQVSADAVRADAAKKELLNEFGDKVVMESDGANIYLRGNVRDMIASGRAVSIAENAGKVVNLLSVDVPPQEMQILVKVRFVDVDRSKSRDLAVNLFSAAKGWPLSVTTTGAGSTTINSVAPGLGSGAFSLSDTLNLFLFDPHLDAGSTVKALEGKNYLEILAEPNLLAMNGQEASFTSGGQFPYPTVQGGGGGLGQLTIAFREFGIRIKVLPVVTPRGTIRLHITPEVSSLDYANSLTISGATVPGISLRRVETEIELQDKQTFAIAGLLDQRATDSLSRIPGLASIPLFGKLFSAKTISRSNSELLVLVTPELVTPIPADKPAPDLERPLPFLDDVGVMHTPPRTPDTEQTGTPSAAPKQTSIPIQEMQELTLAKQARQSNLSALDAQDGLVTGGSASGTPPARPQAPLPVTLAPGSAPAPSPPSSGATN